jgi:hypothetical protein
MTSKTTAMEMAAVAATVIATTVTQPFAALRVLAVARGRFLQEQLLKCVMGKTITATAAWSTKGPAAWLEPSMVVSRVPSEAT